MYLGNYWGFGSLSDSGMCYILEVLLIGYGF